MSKNIKDMTLGEIGDILTHAETNVLNATYTYWDKKHALLNIIINLNDSVNNLIKNEKYITDENFLNSLIKNLID